MDIEKMERKPMGILVGKMSFQTTFSLFVYSAYAVTDTWFVARGAGIMASAGIGVLSPVFLILNGLSTAIGAGAASMLSRALGEKNSTKAADIVMNAFLLFTVCSFVFTLGGELLLNRILFVLRVEGDILNSARIYGRILIAGAVTSTGFSSLMRASGHLGYATLQWILPIGINLCFDAWFIFGCQLGVKGAAWATVLSQIVSYVTSMYFFLGWKKKPYRITKMNCRLKKSIVKEMLLIGCPSLFLQIGNSIITFIFQRFLITFGNEIIYAAYVISERIFQIFWTPHTGIAQGIQPLIGYFSGGKNLRKTREVIRYAVFISILYGAGSLILCKYTFRGIFGFFSDDTEILASGAEILKYLLWLFPIRGIGDIILSVFQAKGNSRKIWALSIISLLVVRFPVVLILGSIWKTNGLWVSFVLSELLFDICSITIMRKDEQKWKV